MTFTVTTEKGSTIQIEENTVVVITIDGIDYEISIMRK